MITKTVTFIAILATMGHAQLEPYVLNVKYDTKVYLLYFKTFSTNTDADAICAKQGGSLVDVYGAEVNRQIFVAMKALIGAHFFHHDNVIFNETWSFWMSKYTPRLNMNYFGSKFERFTNWYLDVLGPTIGSDYNGGANSYGCPNVLLGTETGYWGVAPCNKKMPFVCEIPKEDGRIEADNAIYSIYMQGYKRDKAQALCQLTGGHLPYIKTEDENKLLSNAVAEYASGTSSNFNNFWIGITNATVDYKQWSYDDGSNLTYTNWRNGKIDIDEWSLPYYQSRKHCVASGTDQVWYMVDCNYYNSLISFVCQYEKSKPQVNLTHIEQWANTHELFNTTTNIIINHVNNTQYNNEYNITTVFNNHVENNTLYNSTTFNNNVSNETYVNVLNTTNIVHNSTSNITNTTNVYDRKMMIGHDKSEAIFWTLIGIGSFMVVVTCIILCVCVSCWCVYR